GAGVWSVEEVSGSGRPAPPSPGRGLSGRGSWDASAAGDRALSSPFRHTLGHGSGLQRPDERAPADPALHAPERRLRPSRPVEDGPVDGRGSARASPDGGPAPGARAYPVAPCARGSGGGGSVTGPDGGVRSPARVLASSDRDLVAVVRGRRRPPHLRARHPGRLLR